MKKWHLALIGGLAVLAGIVALCVIGIDGNFDERHLKIGVTPYQDTAAVVVGKRLGWYEEAGLDVELVPLGWSEIPPALSSGAIDVTIFTINAFQAPYRAMVSGTRKPVFYIPIYIHHGMALMVRRKDGFKTVDDVLASGVASSRPEAAAVAARQLNGRRIAASENTDFGRLARAALQAAGLAPESDVTLVNAAPQDALAAFFSGDIDVLAAGATERTEALRRGAVELLLASDLGLPSVDGFVTTDGVWTTKRDALDDFAEVWFKIVRFMESDLEKNSMYVRDYLRSRASTEYSPAEYVRAWKYNQFMKSAEETGDVFHLETSRFLIDKLWKESNERLQLLGTIKEAVPLSAYVGRETVRRLRSPAEN